MSRFLDLKRDINCPVSKDMFGANILFDRDRVGDGGTYDDVAEDIGFTNIRYPGGSVSEWYFDIDDPLRTRADGVNGSGPRKLLPLDEFLSWAGRGGYGVNIVIPTSDLVSGPVGAKVVADDAYDRVKGFVADVLGGTYGSAEISAFEIGNEYWLEGHLDHVEYTAVADVIARAAQDAIDESAEGRAPDWREPAVSIQVGQYGRHSTEPGWQQNDYIMDNLSDAAAQAIDAVVMHYYARGSFDELAAHDYHFDRLDTWARRPEFTGIEYHMTEWGVDSWETTQLGLMQASGLVWMMSRMVMRGVDSAFVWPPQQNTRTDLSGDEGETTLTPAGEVLRMMAEELPGATLVSQQQFDGGVHYTFEDDGETILFVTSRADRTIQVGIDPSELGLYGGTFATEILGSAGAPDDADAAATIELSSGQVRGDILVDLDAFEIARIVISPRLVATEGADVIPLAQLLGGEIRAWGGDDRIFDSLENDLVHAGAGNDLVRARPGRSGDDTLLGEDGNDRLFGGQGHDLIFGGTGDDTLHGGSGDDRLFGQSGDDRIFGGHGNDTLEGSMGLNRLDGGAGDDVVAGWRDDDVIFGGPGNDRLIGRHGADRLLGGPGNDTMIGGPGHDTMSGHAGDDRLHAGSGNDLIRGHNGNDRLFGGAGDDTVSGGSGADLILGGDGNDLLFGGAGADIFAFDTTDGRNWIRDFDAHDRISFAGSILDYDDLQIERSGDILTIHAGETDVLVVDHADLGPSDFIF